MPQNPANLTLIEQSWTIFPQGANVAVLGTNLEQFIILFINIYIIKKETLDIIPSTLPRNVGIYILKYIKLLKEYNPFFLDFCSQSPRLNLS